MEGCLLSFSHFVTQTVWTSRIKNWWITWERKRYLPSPCSFLIYLFFLAIMCFVNDLCGHVFLEQTSEACMCMQPSSTYASLEEILPWFPLLLILLVLSTSLGMTISFLVSACASGALYNSCLHVVLWDPPQITVSFSSLYVGWPDLIWSDLRVHFQQVNPWGRRGEELELL